MKKSPVSSFIHIDALDDRDLAFLSFLGIKNEIVRLANDTKLTNEQKREQLEKIFNRPTFNRDTQVFLQKEHNRGKTRDVIVSEAIIRPTGLIDPIIKIKPVENQVDDILEEVRQRVKKNQRVLITTLTKRFAEELDIYMKQLGVKSAYIHSEVDTLERLDILSDLRRGTYDVLIGINLLREGLDLPEVSLVAIFDADKEGFLRSRTSLIQIIGRAARHEEGVVIMYASSITGSMREAIDETERRREIQIAYNTEHGITPTSTKRELETISDQVKENQAEEVEEVAEEETLENLKLSNKNARGGRYVDKSGKKIMERQRYDAGTQLYANFDIQKTSEIEKIKSLGYSRDQLLVELDLSIDAMNFERAAAIRDILQKK